MQVYECPTYFSDDWLNWFYDYKQNIKAVSEQGLHPVPTLSTIVHTETAHSSCKIPCEPQLSGDTDSSHASVVASDRASEQRVPVDERASFAASSLVPSSEERCASQLASDGVDTGGCVEYSDRRDDERVSTSDYRFVYIGMRGSCTGLHADVLRSYSWSINIAGKKRCVPNQ